MRRRWLRWVVAIAIVAGIVAGAWLFGVVASTAPPA
jgi:hypothetical protein